LVDKSSRMKDAIFGHKLAYRVKNNKNLKSNTGGEKNEFTASAQVEMAVSSSDYVGHNVYT